MSLIAPLLLPLFGFARAMKPAGPAGVVDSDVRVVLLAKPTGVEPGGVRAGCKEHGRECSENAEDTFHCGSPPFRTVKVCDADPSRFRCDALREKTVRSAWMATSSGPAGPIAPYAIFNLRRSAPNSKDEQNGQVPRDPPQTTTRPEHPLSRVPRKMHDPR